MNRLPRAFAATLACVASASAFAQDRQSREPSPQAQKHGGAHHRDGGYRHFGGPRHGHHSGPRHGHHPGPRYWSGPVRAYSYFDPYPVYPRVAYSYAYVEPEPIYVERVYEPRRIYEVEPPRYAERVMPERPRYSELAPRAQAPAQATPVPQRERYTLSAKELFAFDKAIVRGPQPKLDEIAAALRANPGIRDVTITGHTDRLGSEAYNLELSQRRADAVKTYLVERGVEAHRLDTVGKGESEPVVQCTDANEAKLIQCLEPNRRVDVEQITIERRPPLR